MSVCCFMMLVLVMLVMVATSTAYQEVHSKKYLKLSANHKLDIIFNNCLENTSPADWFSAFKMLGLFLESMCPTLTTRGDEMLEDRNKYIHTVGTVALVEWEDLGSHDYTGMFTGADYGIVRLSLAKEADKDDTTTVPGMGLKFLRDGMDSVNLVAMHSLDGQESWNFFKHDFSNHIGSDSSLSMIPIKMKFARTTSHVQQVGLSDWSTHDQYGTPSNYSVFPYRLRFHPTGSITFPDHYTRHYTEDLTTIQKGTVLYQVFAMDKPPQMEGVEMHIGNLVTRSNMMTSWWGDRKLFFRHQDMAEDLKIRPEWKKFTPIYGPEHETNC